MWFTDDGGTKTIGRITPTGAITEFTAGLNPDTHTGSVDLVQTTTTNVKKSKK